MASLTDDQLWQKLESLNVSHLKSILQKSGVPCSQYKKKELLDLAFYAIRLGLEVLPTEKQEDRDRVAAQLQKLKLGPINLPHPSTLDGWDSALKDLPALTEPLVEQYFAECNRKLDIDTDGIKAKKEGKSLLLSGKVSQCSLHPIDVHVGVSFVKGMVFPQTRLNEKPYCVWTLVSKTAPLAVISADCHCISGLSGCCKHVAALLYYAVNHVANQGTDGSAVACTSTLQKWHQPSKKSQAESRAAFMKDIKVRKITPFTDINDHTFKCRREGFDPRAPARRTMKRAREFNMDRLSSATNGNCAILRYNLRTPDPNLLVPDIEDVKGIEVVTTQYTAPEVMRVEEAVTQSSNVESVLSKLKVDIDAVTSLAERTRGQSASSLWMQQREGRLTSSRLSTCVDKISDDMKVVGATHSAIATVMGYYETAKSPALLWGQKKEEIARRMYKSVQSKRHKHLKVDTTGMWMSTEYPFIAASPDGIVRCKCCGKGCLEIKCPWSSRNSTISKYMERTDSCLENVSSEIRVKRDHAYYAQIQTHMHCTGTLWCDFVVYTIARSNNMKVVRVKVDEDFFKHVALKAKVFFKFCIIPEFKERSVKKKVEEHYIKRVMDDLLDNVEKELSKDPVSNTDFLCGSCAELWKDEDKSIECDKCSMWHHYKCVGICGNEDFLKDNRTWFCPNCS